MPVFNLLRVLCEAEDNMLMLINNPDQAVLIGHVICLLLIIKYAAIFVMNGALFAFDETERNLEMEHSKTL